MKISRFFQNLSPPGKWKFPVIILLGTLFGLFIYLVYISRAPSYLSDNPSTCVNCHIMGPQHATWSHSSHREHAHCNDCHVPHNNIFNTYYFKAKDGMRHAYVFTLRNEPQVIFIKEEGRDAVQQNCIRCHENLLVDNKLINMVSDYKDHRTDRNCQDCHRYTPHGRVNSLSSTPYARVPVPGSPVPGWMKKFLETSSDNK